ncbi:uncharacterized protein TrAtP1_003514 [Trichoderma atroviride]|uniref:uncharacterized protein n=1 Tax=Hypocrea atroviridis TaxID=63577 RepID=UPI0033348F40|nr:hypothetical protein TrAtP1_003514 [Trichoderma atroviride]
MYAFGFEPSRYAASMCEQLFKYDCGHLYRRILCCNRPREQHLSSTSFSGQSPSSESHCHGTQRLECRATLCPKCEMQEKDGDVYFNSTKRASLPTAQARTDPTRHHGQENLTATRVSTSSAGIRRTKSNPALLPSQHLRRVQGMDNGSLRNEYTRLELRPDNTFQAQDDGFTGNGSQCTKEIRLELSRHRVDEADVGQHADSSPLDGEYIPSKLAQIGSLKASSRHNKHNLSSSSKQACLKPLQGDEFKLEGNHNAGDSGQPNKSTSPKVQDTGNNTVSNRRNPTRPCQDNSLGARRGKKLRLKDFIMPILELDWYTSTYVPYMLYSPSSGTSFAELLNYSQSESDEPRIPAPEIVRPEIVRPEKKARRRLQKMRSLYHHIDSSNESFVCARAREVENNER